MKKLVFWSMCLMAPLLAKAADHAIFYDEDKWNMYTSPQLQIVEIGDGQANIGTLSIGTMWNENWRLGVRLGAMTSDATVNDGYGDVRFHAWGSREVGLDVGYLFRPADLFHVELALAVSSASYETSGDGKNNFAIYTPSLNLCLNTHTDYELGAGIGWRFCDGFSAGTLDDADASGMALIFFLRITEF